MRVITGDKIILSGPPARHGVAIMSLRQGLEFETSITSDTRPLHKIILQLLDTFGAEIHLLRDPTRGGISTVLNEIAKYGPNGIEINEHAIHIEEEVAGACEMLGLDPYTLPMRACLSQSYMQMLPMHSCSNCNNGSMAQRQQSSEK